MIWQNNFSTINNAGLDRVYQIAETSDGGFIAVGQTTYPLSGGSNIFIFKAGPDGVFPVTAEYYTIDTLVSLPEHSNLQIGIFPNPSKGLFHVQFNQQQSKSVLVYSAMGKLIVNEILFQNGVIDLSTYQDGFYYAKIDQQLFKLIKSSD